MIRTWIRSVHGGLHWSNGNPRRDISDHKRSWHPLSCRMGLRACHHRGWRSSDVGLVDATEDPSTVPSLSRHPINRWGPCSSTFHRRRSTNVWIHVQSPRCCLATAVHVGRVFAACDSVEFLSEGSTAEADASSPSSVIHSFYLIGTHREDAKCLPSS